VDLFIEALSDTIKLLPLLAVVYFFVSFIEYRFGQSMGDFLARFSKIGPVIGALSGCIPQCGFSVIAAALYVKKVISVGTLLAVFLSTSDEAIPVLLSMPGRAGMVGTLILIKIAVAIIAGLTIDLVLNSRKNPQSTKNIPVHDICEHAITGHSGCCAHEVDNQRSKIRSLLLHPLLHTLKIFIFLLVISVILSFILDKIGQERIGKLLLSGSFLQPFIASMIGLIPNCFASVVLAELFTEGIISFSSMVAGLCASAGLGMLVLVKENKNLKDTLSIIGLLVGISFFVGIVIKIIYL